MIGNGANGNGSGAVTYDEFLKRKTQEGAAHGFEPIWIPDFLFDFQRDIVEWAVRKGRAAIFADCGMGKTPMALTWAENVVRRTNGRVLILTPIAVGAQMMREAEKFGVGAMRSRDGSLGVERITITNYEQLDKFSPGDFSGVVCDESSILKHLGGATQKAITRFMLKIPYRLLCTATAAPNDHHEMGTSSEALGYLGKSDMLTKFFRQNDAKAHRMNDVKLARAQKSGSHYAKLAYRVSQQIGQWTLKPHADQPFWRWVCSWAKACRKPSDLGYQDGAFQLPPLQMVDHVISATRPPEGKLFHEIAFGLRAERDERRRTLEERTDAVAGLVDHSDQAVVWCDLNVEGDRLAEKCRDAVQVKGSDCLEKKEEILTAFSEGRIRVLVTKPKIGGHGMNWQNCSHVVMFATHSYEQSYQCVRRCWRFGQKNPVRFDVVFTEGELRVRENMARKAEAMEKMFTELVRNSERGMSVETNSPTDRMEVPAWL